MNLDISSRGIMMLFSLPRWVSARDIPVRWECIGNGNLLSEQVLRYVKVWKEVLGANVPVQVVA